MNNKINYNAKNFLLAAMMGLTSLNKKNMLSKKFDFLGTETTISMTAKFCSH